MRSNNFLEQILTKIRITPERQEYIKNVVKKIFDKFQEVVSSCYNYRFGGSFKRYTSIKNYFDVDVYFIGKFPEYNLMRLFYSKLRELEFRYHPFNIARAPPYFHAIPAIFNDDIELDCLAAIDLGDGYYKIPEGERIIIINPDLDEEKLTHLNCRNNGKGTKIIRLLKKWNSINSKPFKSYQLEAMVYSIFDNQKIQALDKGLKTFFYNGIEFLRQGYQIYDDIDNHQILKGLNRIRSINLMHQSFKLIQQNKWTKVFPTI